MASQVAHLIYAHKYFEKYPNHLNKDEFILGCTFPDIRRIDNSIKRKDTHLKFDKLDLDFDGMTSFQAGWKFHLYCDMKREQILNGYNFYSLKNAEDFWHLSAKLLEDELIYEEFNNWEKIIHYFCNPPKVDTGINVSRETFDLWYAINAKYLERKPCSHSMGIFLSKQPKLATMSADIVKSVDELRKNERAKEVLKKVLEEIV